MARNESKKLPFTLFLISLSLHLFVFAASSHEYVWSKPVKTSRPLKFRVVYVEKAKEKLPPNPKSRFLSNANRKESGSGKPGKTPRLRRENKDRIPSRRGELVPNVATLAPVPKSKLPVPVATPVRPTPPAVVIPKPELKKVEKLKERKPLPTPETKETPQLIETARLSPAPKPPLKIPSPARREKIKPKEEKIKSKAREEPIKKKIANKVVAKDKRKPKPVVKKKVLKEVVRKKPPKEKKKVQAKGIRKKKLKVAVLKPVLRPIRPRRPAPKRPQTKDPLALFRVKPQPKGKPNAPKFDLSDEAADKIAKKGLSDKDREKEEGETIFLDTREFRYASYFAHIKRRIQNAWIWPPEAQKYGGRLLLRFRLRKNGTLEEVRLIKSAGIRILDDLAMAAVTKAAPFEPIPVGLERLARKSITAKFSYEGGR